MSGSWTTDNSARGLARKWAFVAALPLSIAGIYAARERIAAHRDTLTHGATYAFAAETVVGVPLLAFALSPRGRALWRRWRG